jgi:signal transduction histidine kinase
MGFRIRHIATRFALILAVAAILPLVAYGVVSIVSLRSGTRQSIITGNLNVATRAADEISRYVSGNADILKALGADLQDTGLQLSQQDRIVKNYVHDFPEFREITLFDESGGPIASSRVGPPRVGIPRSSTATLSGSVAMSPIHVDDDLLPTTVFAVHLRRLNQPSGWLVGEFSLEEMWRMVDQIRIGDHGYALVVAPDGALVAHGDPDKKALIARGRNMKDHPLVAVPPSAGRASVEYLDENGRQQLAVSARIDQLGWTVIVEQPTSEAYATAIALQRQLIVTIAAALLVMIGIGLLFGRKFIAPIFILQRGTQAVAAGDLTSRVTIGTRDEFGQLGDAFNAMADRLVELQEDVKHKERQATFGRVAAGIVHDLSHPIQNIGNSARLMMRDDVDAESRESFRRTIDRELVTLKRFMEDLRNVVKPKPVERFAMDVNGPLTEVVEAMRVEGERHAVTVEAQYAEGPLVMEGDRFALGRVFRNLITNAIQATEPGGRVSIATGRAGDLVVISVADTGSGIPADRLSRIFDDFVTTKRRGLGLGLAISKRIVEQLDGTITVESEVGRGTSFTLRFPARSDLATQAAAS